MEALQRGRGQGSWDVCPGLAVPGLGIGAAFPGCSADSARVQGCALQGFENANKKPRTGMTRPIRVKGPKPPILGINSGNPSRGKVWDPAL